VRADGRTEPLGVNGQVTLSPGDWIVSVTAAGGGFGIPVERDPARVRKDIREGWISEQRAAEIYGVILDSHQRVDEQATISRRAAMKRETKSVDASP
jgi:N-methylhydantoinase B